MKKWLDVLRHHPNTRPVWKLVAAPFGLTMYAAMKFLDITSKVTILGNMPTEPVIYTKWHTNIPYFVTHNGKYKRALLTGNSPYMEPAITMIELNGMKILRGGSKEHRNADQSAISLMSKELLEEKNSVVIAIDGPTGPIYEPKRGFLELAKETGAKIVPIVYACKYGKPSTSRWDKIWWPRPFDHILIQYGEPYTFNPNQSIDEQIKIYRDIMLKLDANNRIKLLEMGE